jgi:hypothetical protein
VHSGFPLNSLQQLVLAGILRTTDFMGSGGTSEAERSSTGEAQQVKQRGAPQVKQRGAPQVKQRSSAGEAEELRR